MVPRCIFMQPGSIGARYSNNTTYIQNNFFGGKCPQNIWSGYPRVTMRPMYYQTGCTWGIPFYSYMPGFVQNAITRFMGFNLIQSMMNLGKTPTLTPGTPETPETPQTPESQLTAENMHASQEELDEVNNKYQTS